MSVIPEAEDELDEITYWYENRQPLLGQRFLSAVQFGISEARHFPEVHQLIGLRTRRFKLHRFPYVVYYVVEKGQVLVTGVFHERRDRPTWDGRIRELKPIYSGLRLQLDLESHFPIPH